jgi:hypothetical protein
MSFIYVPTTSTPNVSGGAAGEVLYQSGVGTTAFTAVGTAGQLLQSNGASAPTWITPSSGSGMTLISTKTADNTANTITFTGLSGYNKYVLITSQLLCSAANSYISLTFGYGATPTYITSGYFSTGQYDSNLAASPTQFYTTSGSAVSFGVGSTTNSSGIGETLVMNINNFINSPYNVNYNFQSLSYQSSFYIYSTTGGYVSMSSNPATAIKISSTNNFTQGTVSLYGLSS